MVNPNWTTIKLNDGERVDDLERSGLRIIQDVNKFCFGIDAVLLSGYAKVKKGEKALDMCSGNGIIPILLSAKSEGSRLFGVEIQEECVSLAQRSIAANGIEDRVNVSRGDIRNIEAIYEKESFDVVTCNPPYMIDNHGIKNPDSPKAIARHEIMCDFHDVANAASGMLKQKGRFYLIHRPFRLVEIFGELTKVHLEPKSMRLVYPYIDHEPNMVLIEAIKGGRSRITIEKPLIVYESENKYTQEIYDIYGY